MVEVLELENCVNQGIPRASSQSPPKKSLCLLFLIQETKKNLWVSVGWLYVLRSLWVAGTWLPVSLVDKEFKSAIIALMKVTGSSCGGFPKEAPCLWEVIKHFLNCLSCLESKPRITAISRSHRIYQWLLQQPPTCTVLFLGRGSAKEI